jgi:hypothetical protein
MPEVCMFLKLWREIKVSPFILFTHFLYLFLVWNCNSPQGKLKIKEDTAVYSSTAQREEDLVLENGTILKKTSIGFLTEGQEVSYIAEYSTKSSDLKRVNYKFSSAYISRRNWDKFIEIKYWHSYGNSHFCEWVLNLFEGCENY